MMLTDAERDSLDTCECGHWACEHTIDGCATVIPEEDGGEYQDDYGAYLCPCLSTPEAIRLDAVEALVAARDQAWRDRIRATADELDRIATDCRDRPISDRWVGRAVAYGASASKLRALAVLAAAEGATDA